MQQGLSEVDTYFSAKQNYVTIHQIEEYSIRSQNTRSGRARNMFDI